MTVQSWMYYNATAWEGKRPRANLEGLPPSLVKGAGSLTRPYSLFTPLMPPLLTRLSRGPHASPHNCRCPSCSVLLTARAKAPANKPKVSPSRPSSTRSHMHRPLTHTTTDATLACLTALSVGTGLGWMPAFLLKFPLKSHLVSLIDGDQELAKPGT
jgi:hypothetical protein